MSKITKKEGLIEEELDGELIVFDKERGYVHTIDENGTIVWQLIDKCSTIADIEAEYIKILEDTPEPALVKEDLNGFFKYMQEQGLLTVE